MNINKDQIKSGIIALLALTLVAGVVFFYKKPFLSDTLTEKENIKEEQTVENEDDTISENSISNEISENISASSGSAELDLAKFNTALKAARTAFFKQDYRTAITKYKLALKYKNSDIGYYGLFSVYVAQNDFQNAGIAINKAISLNPSYTELWNAKLVFLDEKTNTTFADLKKVYEEGLKKVDPKTVIDLITYFARIAENNGQKGEAIALWEYAQKTYPKNTSIYQAEIDRLKKIL